MGKDRCGAERCRRSRRQEQKGGGGRGAARGRAWTSHHQNTGSSGEAELQIAMAISLSLDYIWPWTGPGRAWAGPKKAHGKKLRPRPYHRAYISSPSPAHLVKSPEKPLALRAVGRASSLKCQYVKPKPVQALLVGSKLRPKPGPWASPSGLGHGF